jgi:hypothetical protein
MVEAQHPAEPLGALDCTECRSQTIVGLDQPIVDPLVILGYLTPNVFPLAGTRRNNRAPSLS